MQAVGVASAKIEGRLRTPEYVAAAVSACLAGREGRAYDRDLLKNAFSRSGFTSGYLDGKIDGTMFGVRSEADAELTKKTLPALRELYRRERSRVPVQFRLEIEEGGEKLTVTDADGNKAFAYGDAEPQPARTDPTESLQRSLSKTGGTPFAVEKIDVEMDGGPWFVPGSAVNELRRDALEALLKKREVLRPWPVYEAEPDALPLRTLPPRRTLRARFETWDQVPEQALSGVEYLILPIAQADRVPREWRGKTLLELPRVMFGALEEAFATVQTSVLEALPETPQPQEAPPQPVQAGTLDEDQKAQLQHFKEMLALADPERIAEALMPLTAFLPSALMEKLQQAIDFYDYDEALALLPPDTL